MQHPLAFRTSNSAELTQAALGLLVRLDCERPVAVLSISSGDGSLLRPRGDTC
jgi:hypothetical protein